MPRLNQDDLQNFQGGHYGFSAVGIENLGASEYTLVTIIADRSSSTTGFQSAMEECLKQIIKSCQQSPRADNLMIRLLAFATHKEEIHGFKLLSQCNLSDYDGVLSPQGSTALNDATIDGIEALANYGKSLQQNDFEVNGIVFVITDGEENTSTFRIDEVKRSFESAVRSENLESLLSILIGVNITDPHASRELNRFKTEAGFSQYVELDNANQKTLAKLAAFVSKSISSQSQALGSGSVSQTLTF